MNRVRGTPVRELFDLTGRVAVVTGGAGQYGTPIVEGLAEAGALVVIASRSDARCQEAAECIRAAGGTAEADTFDQADETSVLALRDRLVARHGHVDVVVNNAVARPMRRFEDPLEAWRASMDVNATGFFAVSRAFLQTMIAQRQGSLIHIGSIQSVAAPVFGNYAGTSMTTPPDYHFHKHGLVGLTKYLAAFAGPHGVRVNAISPGGFASENHPPDFRERYHARTLLGRMASHDDIKGAVVYLASAASAYVTGQNLVVDGGYSA